MRALVFIKRASATVGFIMLGAMAGMGETSVLRVWVWLIIATILLWFGGAFKK